MGVASIPKNGSRNETEAYHFCKRIFSARVPVCRFSPSVCVNMGAVVRALPAVTGHGPSRKGEGCGREAIPSSARMKQGVFADDAGVSSCAKLPVPTPDLAAAAKSEDFCAEMWKRMRDALDSPDELCIKPMSDGCSTGVCRLSCEDDLGVYARAVSSGASP